MPKNIDYFDNFKAKIKQFERHGGNLGSGYVFLINFQEESDPSHPVQLPETRYEGQMR